MPDVFFGVGGGYCPQAPMVYMYIVTSEWKKEDSLCYAKNLLKIPMSELILRDSTLANGEHFFPNEYGNSLSLHKSKLN